MKARNSVLFFIIPFLFALVGCKKISTPGDASKEVFGQWQYVYDSGGFSGGGGSTTFKENSWVEFCENGVYKVYEGSKKMKSQRFKIETNDGSANYKINFSSRTISDYSYLIEEDKLVLSEDVSDGFSYVFTRK